MLTISCSNEQKTVYLVEITPENTVFRSAETNKVVSIVDAENEFPGFDAIRDAENIQDILAILESFNPAYLWAHVSGKL